MMYYETVKTSEDEIIIEDDRVYSSKLGTGIATVIECSELADSMNVPNFNIQIKFKQGRSTSINYTYKNEIDLNRKLDELECFLIEVKDHFNESVPIFAFNRLIKPSEITSIEPYVRIDKEKLSWKKS